MQKTKKLYTGESHLFLLPSLNCLTGLCFMVRWMLAAKTAKPREEGLIELHGWICITSWKEERGGGRPMAAAEEEEEKSLLPLVAETQVFLEHRNRDALLFP